MYVFTSGDGVIEGVIMWNGIIFLIIVNNSFDQSCMKFIRYSYGSIDDLYYISDCMNEYNMVFTAILVIISVMSKLFSTVSLIRLKFAQPDIQFQC